MTHDDINRPLATPDQAFWLVDHFISKLPPVSSTHNFERDYEGIIVPPKIAEHFLSPDPLAQEVQYGARTQILYVPSVKLAESFYLANIYFLQTEVIDPKLSYVSRIGYHVLRQPTIGLTWERRLVLAEKGEAQNAVARQIIAKMLESSPRPIDLKVFIEASREREALDRTAENEFGLRDVYADEASEVLRFLSIEEQA